MGLPCVSAIPLQPILKSGVVVPPAVLSLFDTVLTILGFFCFHTKLKTVLSRSLKMCPRILMGIALYLQNAIGRMIIFTLNPTMGEHGRSFHVLIPSSTSLFCVLKLYYMSLSLAWSLTPKICDII